MSIPSGFGSYSYTKARSSHTPTPAYSPPPPLHQQQQKLRWGSNQFYSQSEKQQSEFNQDLIKSEDNTNNEDDEEDDVQDDEEIELLGWRGQGKGKTLSINSNRNKIGGCFYDGEVGKLYFFNDQQDDNNWSLLNKIVQQINPSIVLTSVNVEESFIEILTQTLSEQSETSTYSEGEDSTSCQLEYRASREFYPGQGKIALSRLIITENNQYYDDDEEASSRGERYYEEGRGGEGYENRGEEGEEEEIEGERNAYDFGKKKYKKKRNYDPNMEQGDRARRNKELRMEGFINSLESCPLTLGSLGCLLNHITRTISTSGELDNAGQVELSGLQSMEIDQVMSISQDALSSLQIFTSVSHATSHSDYKKEGLSLFGILNRAKTPLGRSLMTTWFLRPSLDIDLINSRHSAVECFLRIENQAAVDTITEHFRSIKNIGKTLRVLGNGRGTLRDWKSVWSFIYGAVMIRDAVLTLTGRKDLFVTDKIIDSFDPEDLRELGGMINDVIDWEESGNQQGRIIVKAGTNEELDALRRSYDGLPSLLSDIAIQISKETSPEFTETLSLVYFPQLGYLITIPYKESTDSDSNGIIGRGGILNPNDFPHQEDWQFQFVTESSAYFKSDKCRDLDNHLGDLHSFVSDKEIEIVHALLNELMKREQELIEASEALSELDCLIAFAEAARMYEWNKPHMTLESVTRIRQFRHPLVELCVDSFVKNDISLVGGRGTDWNIKTEEEIEEVEEGIMNSELSMIVVTGANYSGKSVFLKSIAMLTFMAQIGSFIPAERALIGVTDRILTRISTKESISRGASAFMIDLQQISFILRNATSRSLIIIDEFGKGTESGDGAGLFCGVLEHLINRGSEAPRVAASTHFQDVFANGLLDSALLPIGLAHMDILLHEPKSLNNDTNSSKSNSSLPTSNASREVTYLYRLAPGLSTSSHAAACASLFGIDSSTINRATEITNLLSKFEIATLLNSDLNEEEKEELRESEAIARRFIAIDWTETEGGMLDLDLEDLKRILIDECLKGQ